MEGVQTSLGMQVFRKMTDEEKKALQTFVIDGMPRQVDEIKSRRKKKGDFQYEVSWKNLPSIKYNKWINREVLLYAMFPFLLHAAQSLQV
jgi:hypothetical protein